MAFRSFRKVKAIPAFLQGMLSQIFDRDTGRIINNEKACNDTSTIVEAIRQICLCLKKVKVPCTLERTSKALQAFVDIEQSLNEFKLSADDREDFLHVCQVLWPMLVSSCELDQLVPRHGPGATAEGISGNQKYRWQFWYDRLEPYFPLIGAGYPLGTEPESEDLEIVSIVSGGQEEPVKVTPVPKTLKSPRIIAVEPCCMQFAQHAIQEWLTAKLESHWMTSGHVNFRDQTINQGLAMVSSSTGRYATIDLSDASDRVPRDLALEMFDSHPDLKDAIDACRSNSAKLPNGEIISPLRKFASMGSALCFPVEAMYFYTICVVALLKEHNLPATTRNVYNVSRDVYVFGDDIIVPTTNAGVVLAHLQKYNCKVNSNKTFVSGSFRESCGVDAFNGVSVTPTYLRELPPENKRQDSELVSWVATSNLFYKRGYWRTTLFMRKRIDKILGPLPYVSETSPALGYISYLGYRSAERWNNNLQRLEIKALVPSPVYRTDRLTGYSALSKSLRALDRLGKDGLASRDALHLERFALHGAVVLKRRWVAALT
jgi:hypothetical protein